MKFLRLMVFVLTLLSVFSAVGISSEQGGGHGTSHVAAHHHIASWDEVMMPLLYRNINFIVFIGLLIFLLRKPVHSFLATRRKEVEEIIKGSAEKKAWAEQMYADYEKRLQGIGKEIEEIKASLKREGEIEAEKMVIHAQSLSENVRRDARLVADAEFESFKTELRDKVIEKAAEVARETIQQAINASDQERLQLEFLKEIRERQ